MRYGLILDVVQDIKEYVLGASKMPYIEYTDGDWESYLPKYEAQADRFESFGCTLWGLQNQLEIFEKMLYGVEPNYDEWFNYPLIPINADGKAPQITYESVREHGLVPAKTLREPRTREEALDTDRISGSVRAKGQNWLLQHDFQHEWVWPTNRRPQNYLEVLKDAIKTSPIALSVTAWYEENGLYVDRGKRNNHWCVAYKIDDTGIYIFDTYNHSKKKLALNHNIEIAKRIWLNKKTRRASKRHVTILERILNIFMKKTPIHPLAKGYPVTQKFLNPSKEYESGVHNGTDYACPIGTSIHAPMDGEIIHVFENHKELGNAVYFASADGKYIRFLHLSDMMPCGEYKQGEVIGKTGNTGKSTGPHLHLDVWNIPFNTHLIKTRAGVEKYMLDPEKYFLRVI